MAVVKATKVTTNPFIHVAGQQGTSTYKDPVTHPVTNPFIHVAGQQGNPNGTDTSASPVVVVQPTPVVTPPKPVKTMAEYEAEAALDPEYTLGSADLKRHNDEAVADLLKNWVRGNQDLTDNANSHGALFSGAAANAMANRAVDYSTAGTRLTADWQSADATLKNNVKNKIIQQYIGSMGTNG